MNSYPDGVKVEDRPCPNGCAAQDEFVVEGWDRLHAIPGCFKVLRCMHCGLMRTNPRPTRETIGTYYPADYRPHQGAPANAGGNRTGLRRWVERSLGFETRSIPPMAAGHLLEIGCSTGVFMEQMRQKGWSAEGIEFSEPAATQARARGFPVQTATVETVTCPSRPVDLIAAWMVLEHLHDPVGALNKMRTWIRSDGYLIASIPDAGSMEFRLFGKYWFALQLPTHLYHFTPKSIATLLHTGGWELKRTIWQPNCNNLLWSLEYWATDKQHSCLHAAIYWLRTARSAGMIRAFLGWLLGALRQSGRIEIWAQPARHHGTTRT